MAPDRPVEERLRRLLYREALEQPDLYRDAGLDRLPSQLADAIGGSPDGAIARLLGDMWLDALSIEQLERLLQVRDMRLTSRTAAAVSTELKDPAVDYDKRCRWALIYALAGLQAHAFAALRTAATDNDSFARHHYLYGLLLALEGNNDRALWELDMALEREPYEDGRLRIRMLVEMLK